jgi:hypothetical protein
MGITIKGLDGLQKKLREMQRPEFIAQLLDDKFRHLRCPIHRQSPKHRVNATKTSATASYCCEELKALHMTKLRGNRSSENRDLNVQQGRISGSSVEPLVEDPKEQED